MFPCVKVIYSRKVFSSLCGVELWLYLFFLKKTFKKLYELKANLFLEYIIFDTSYDKLIEYFYRYYIIHTYKVL